jgi:biuret amidohydrolase
VNPDPRAGWQWPPLVPDFPLDPEGTALVVVDMQAFTCDRELGWGPVLRAHYPPLYAHYYDRLEGVVLPALVRLLAAFRASGRPRVFLTVGPHLASGADLLRLRGAVDGERVARIGPLGSEVHAVHAPLAPRADEIVLNKVTRSGFTSTGLDQILRNQGVTTLLVGGTLTNSCVETTARDAADRGYRTVMIEDGCLSFDPDSHDAALLAFRRIYGKVQTADAALAAIALPAP